ncbi:MAG: ATP-binding cassette domain-containing protein, partial [Gammaproteobacteria bacterium]|nr:ATP-binding cassette domain-containing protein [Gammaproteobacteria bacterium]
MLQLIDVILKRGERAVFDGASLTVHAGHTAGVVGRNGVGKTTLVELIRGRLLPEEGEVLRPRGWRLAWLDQAVEPSVRSALDFALDGDRPLRAVQAEIAAAERAGNDDALAHLHVQLEDVGGYDAEARAGEVLHGLGFG